MTLVDSLKTFVEKYGRTAGWILLVLMVLNFATLMYLRWSANSYIARVEQCEKEKQCRCGLVNGFGSDEIGCV